MPSTTDSATVLTGMYAAEAEYLAAGGPGEASFDLLAPFFAPDVELHQADALPYGGTWRGHQGMTQFFLMMGEAWESFDMVEQEFLATGETAVVLTQSVLALVRRAVNSASRFCKRSRSRTGGSPRFVRSTGTRGLSPKSAPCPHRQTEVDRKPAGHSHSLRTATSTVAS